MHVSNRVTRCRPAVSRSFHSEVGSLSALAQSATRIGLFSLLVAAATLSAEDIYKQQIWQSADGRAITAAVLELEADAKTVKMRRADGLVFTLEFEQFAVPDAQRLQSAALKQAQAAAAPPPETAREAPPETAALPERFECDDVPMVRQKGNFCVPASATMIAGFHGIETDQDQIAFLSSAGSFNNQGTNPHDMLLAMQKLGFVGKALYWKTPEDFQKDALPAIRDALVNQGPIYVSFRPGVFGESGHGCVIIGYHDRKEELTFHNPWGSVFTKKYEDVAVQAHGVVLIEAPEPAPIADEAFVQKTRAILPKFDRPLLELPQALSRGNLKHQLVWCSRRDARDDERFAINTARDDGRKILSLAFRRNPAVLLPHNKDGRTTKYLFVTRPPAGGARFMVREITEDGWSEPELATLGSLTRYWPTRIESNSDAGIIWELPMIELHPDD